MEIKERDHLLALKVMRLTRPSLFSTLFLTCDTKDIPYEAFQKELLNDIGAPTNLSMYNTGNLLMLPQSFGNIYLGEIFSCYMSVHNDSNMPVCDVSVKVSSAIHKKFFKFRNYKLISIQYQTLWIFISKLDRNVHILYIFYFRNIYLGEIFSCYMSVHNDSNMPVCDVSVKSDEVYLEAQLQNITSNPICLERVSLEPSSYFTAMQLNFIGDKDGSHSVFGDINCLNPLDSRQYLFCLSPKSDVRTNGKFMKGITSIGKLDIIWRSSMGERGRLQTSQLERMAPGYGDIRLTVVELPSIVTLESTFEIVCRITNSCERTMDLILNLDTHCSNGILWQGVTGRQLGKFEPYSSLDLKLNAVAIRLGLMVISGIRLIDSFLKRTYDYDEVAQIFVCPKETDYQ
ncbi:trafficking protein particle complex subunit 13-like [Centruroides sculpturatus]|uniref:trafficking protein particle complex subunit 13-like n=1 Tax=Centruroides sculpturatus TaxID=218467 RepID=UPI000C6D77D4|nr:trafficking protein particle complex subunit 13-like [Centruroides sculpturatus]